MKFELIARHDQWWDYEVPDNEGLITESPSGLNVELRVTIDEARKSAYVTTYVVEAGVPLPLADSEAPVDYALAVRLTGHTAVMAAQAQDPEAG